ncbi:hypothetical protein K8I31_17225 [bacterium]|nr:hypothetical protein [bacterium]
MRKKKWIFIGCGGCLVIVLIGVGIIGLIGYSIREIFANFPKEMEEMEEIHKEVKQDYPFELNVEGILEPERIDKFFNVREATIASAEENISWLLQLGDESMPMQKENTFSVIRNMMETVSKFPRIGVERARALREQGMSLNEYEYISRVLSIEVVSWREMEEDSANRQIADAYFQPLQNFEDNLKAYKESHPWNGINDNGEFSVERYCREVQKDLDEADINREAFLERADRITSASAAVFVDLWTNQVH